MPAAGLRALPEEPGGGLAHCLHQVQKVFSHKAWLSLSGSVFGLDFLFLPIGRIFVRAYLEQQVQKVSVWGERD